MSELSAAAAAALGVPEAIVMRSAAARAAETGMSVDDVLTAWAGGSAVAGSTPQPAPEEASAEPEATAPEPETPANPPAEERVSPTVAAPVATPPMVTTRAPVPAEVTPAQAAALDEVVTVPTAGIRERTNFVLPRWLAWVMLIIPLFALFALGGAATGTCGEATELQTDVISGEIVNCDGSEFTGSGIGGGGTDFIALGERIYNGEGATCAGCHGAQGGGGAGPALTGVLTTFSVCVDHMEWVRLGTQGFQEEGRDTYGDTDKPVGGVGTMPSHASLSEEQLAAVVAYERVRFGSADPAQTLTDCGLVAAEGEGTVPAEGGTTVPGDGGTTTPGESTATTAAG